MERSTARQLPAARRTTEPSSRSCRETATQSCPVELSQPQISLRRRLLRIGWSRIRRLPEKVSLVVRCRYLRKGSRCVREVETARRNGIRTRVARREPRQRKLVFDEL